MKPRMTVKDIFQFKDGRTVLSVTLDSDAKLIEAGEYDLLQNGRHIQQVHIENEMLTRNRHANGQRSVSTTERVNLPSGCPQDEIVLVPHI
jgi:hypothetical protein